MAFNAAFLQRATGVFLVAIAASELVQLAWGHGMVLEPPNRASLWRFPEFRHLEPPHNYEDNQLFCGGFKMQYEFNDGKCGVCGDPYNETVPRTHEDGGENYRGVIVRGYRSGEKMPVEITLTASHHGYFQFRLCAKNDTNSHLSQQCYDEHLLKFYNSTSGREETEYRIPVRGEPYYAKYEVTLPKEIDCEHCVLQWHYWTANVWGNCTDGTEGMECGNQEVFRACSDIKIYAENTNESDINRNPNSKMGIFPIPEPANTTTVANETESEEEDNYNPSSNWGKFLQRVVS